ncbi:MAG: winged helix-turn-helix domain-containing protein [Pseudomonadota bacterium]|nr:winged helix-turn-helix domain-containing protein [Pseudomonadota bacterium]
MKCLEFAPAEPAAVGGAGGPSDAVALETVGALMQVRPADFQRARGLFTLLGDPGRRTVLESLSRRPQRPSETLPEATGMNEADIYHRLRSLRRGAVISRDRHHVYRVDPDALGCASRYVDTLMAAAALTQGTHSR